MGVYYGYMYSILLCFKSLQHILADGVRRLGEKKNCGKTSL